MRVKPMERAKTAAVGDAESGQAVQIDRGYAKDKNRVTMEDSCGRMSNSSSNDNTISIRITPGAAKPNHSEPYCPIRLAKVAASAALKEPTAEKRDLL